VSEAPSARTRSAAWFTTATRPREGACAFTWWCDGEGDIPAEHADWPEERDDWAPAEAVAREMLADPDRDVTGGALYYHTEDVHPVWVAERRWVAKIGQHIYYR
jgi:spore germination cell wall hydrolase CwlJ-like protein